MRLNTITFDANLPTTQQVNVPTNTDYKVGMKVKRNGEVQQLGPDEFTIYTGEINVIPPTQYTSTTLSCENSGAMQFLNLKDNALSAVAGKRIKSTDIWVEFSFDNGATWTKGEVDQYTVPVKINDRSSGSNNYIALANLSNPAKWTLLDHNVPTGEYADYVTVPDVPYIMIQFLGSNFTNITSYPCLWRFVFLYGGQEIPVTISADTEKTNGYVTFTQAAGDDASFRQLSVVVDKADEYSDTTSAVSTATGQRTNLNITLDLSAFAGMELTPENIKLEYLSGDTYVEVEPAPAQTNTGCYIAVNGSPVAFWQDGKFWAYDTDWYSFDTLTLPEGATFSTGSIQGRHTTGATITYPATFKASVGDMIVEPGFTANFKLNVNEFKSQSGDINVQTDPEFSTAKVEGTYADGTEFSFDFCVQ